MLLHIVNTLSDHQPLSSLSSFEDLSLFGSSLQNFFTNFIQFVGDDDIPSSNKGENNNSELCMVQFYLLPSPPGNPRDKSGSWSPGVGNCLKRFCPGGRGGDKSKITSCFSCEARH